MRRYAHLQTSRQFQLITSVIFLIFAASSLATGGEIAGVVRDSKGKPVPDTIVFILNVPGMKFPPPKKLIPMDQINRKFMPHVLPVLVGSTVTFPNKDNIHHHIFSFSRAKKFDRPLYKGTNVEPVVLDKVGLVKLGCNIHDTMSGIIFVLQNPYFGVTDKQGRYIVRDMSSKNQTGGIPAGKYKLVAWNEFMKSKLSETVQAVVIPESGQISADYSLQMGRAKRKKKKPGSYGEKE